MYELKPLRLQHPLKQIETPSWTLQDVTYGSDDLLLKNLVQEQKSGMLEAVRQHLEWFFTSPEAIEKMPMHRGFGWEIDGDYFTGRQHYLWDPTTPGTLLAEIEVCMTGSEHRKEGAEGLSIHQRFVVIQRWNPADQSSKLFLWQDIPPHESPFDLFVPHLIRTLRLQDVRDQRGLVAEHIQQLEDRWSDVLGVLQEVVDDTVKGGFGMGTLTGWGFGDLVTLNGQYYIVSIRPLNGREGKAYGVELHLRQHPRKPDKHDQDHMGIDFELNFQSDGALTWELWSTNAIGGYGEDESWD